MAHRWRNIRSLCSRGFGSGASRNYKMTVKLPTRRMTESSERQRARPRRQGCELSQAKKGLCVGEHRVDPDPLEGGGGLRGERYSLLGAPGACKPVGPVELGACCPVRIAKVAKQSFRSDEVVLYDLVLASCASDQCPGAL